MRWQDNNDENTGAGGGGSTTKDIGNTNPPTQWSPTVSQANQKYELKSQKKGTTKQNSKGNKASTPAPWNQRGTVSPNQPAKATADIGNPNPANKATNSPSSKPTAATVRTSGGDLALRARAAGKGGSGTGRSRNASAAGNGFINRG